MIFVGVENKQTRKKKKKKRCGEHTKTQHSSKCVGLSCVNGLWGWSKLLERNVSSGAMKDNNYTALISSCWSGWILKTPPEGGGGAYTHTHTHVQIEAHMSSKATFTHAAYVYCYNLGNDWTTQTLLTVGTAPLRNNPPNNASVISSPLPRVFPPKSKFRFRNPRGL